MEHRTKDHVIAGATTITSPYPFGQRFDAIAVAFGQELVGAELETNVFAVEQRTVKRIYTNDCAKKADSAKAGRFIIIEMDETEAGAEEIFFDPAKAKKPKEGEPFSPGMCMPPAEVKVPEATLVWNGNVTTASGEVLIADRREIHTGKVTETLVDRFVGGQKYRLKYNLFCPKETEKPLPLIVFIPDAGMNGADAKIALLQGGGATLFASDEVQQKQPCYILAFQIPSGIPFTTDECTCAPEFEDVKKIIDEVVAAQNIDAGRIYLTGQSQGCMASCELNARYPDFFAASLLVAGQWDAKKVGAACAKKNFWIFVSDGDEKAYPGMTELTDELKKNGASVGYYQMNAKAPLAEQEQAIRTAEKDDVNIRFTVFTNHSVLPEGTEDNGGTNHMATWPAVYRLDALREWLLSQPGI